MKQQFKTHKEIDDFYRTKGVDVDKFNREGEAVGKEIVKGMYNAKSYIKRKLGWKYVFWKIFSFELIPPLISYEQEKVIRKAKRLCWKDTFKYHKAEKFV